MLQNWDKEFQVTIVPENFSKATKVTNIANFT